MWISNLLLEESPQQENSQLSEATASSFADAQ